jgi:hypothetical protein
MIDSDGSLTPGVAFQRERVCRATELTCTDGKIPTYNSSVRRPIVNPGIRMLSMEQRGVERSNSSFFGAKLRNL